MTTGDRVPVPSRKIQIMKRLLRGKVLSRMMGSLLLLSLVYDIVTQPLTLLNGVGIAIAIASALGLILYPVAAIGTRRGKK